MQRSELASRLIAEQGARSRMFLGLAALVATAALILLVILPGGATAEEPLDSGAAAVTGPLPPFYVPSPGGVTIGVADITSVEGLLQELGFNVESLTAYDPNQRQFTSFIPGAPERVNLASRELLHGRFVVFVRRNSADLSGVPAGTLVQLSTSGTSGTPAVPSSGSSNEPVATSTPNATPSPTATASATPVATVTPTASPVAGPPVAAAIVAPTATAEPTATPAPAAIVTPVATSTPQPTAVPKAAAPGCEAVPASRLALLNQRVGFGASVTGGAEGCLYRVTNANDSGPGSLRDGAEADNRWVVFDGNVEIQLRSVINLGSNVTIDGRGASVVINGALHADGKPKWDGHTSSNMIVHNVTIQRAGPGFDDLLRVRDGATQFWFDHLTLSDAADEYIDITKPGNGGSTGTISWVRFEPGRVIGTDRGVLIGDETGYGTNGLIHVTMHHNLHNGTNSRQPLITAAKVHSFNNVLRWRELGLEIRRGGSEVAEVVSENDVFDPSAAGWSSNKGLILYDRDNYVRVTNPLLLPAQFQPLAVLEGCDGPCIGGKFASRAFNPASRYGYQLDPVENVQGRVTSGAGRQNVSIAE